MDGPLSFATCSYETLVAETLIDPERICKEFDEEVAPLRQAPRTQEIPVVRRRPSPVPRGA